MPTIVLGAQAALAPASIAGLSNSVKPTTITIEAVSNATLTSVLTLLGFGA